MIEYVKLSPICTTSFGFTMAANQCLGLGLVVEQVLGLCYDTMSKIPHIFFHIFLYRDEYGYISIQREKLEAKLGYTQITPIIIVDP